MSTVIETLITKLGLDGSGFLRGADQVAAKSKELGGKVQKTLGDDLKRSLAGAFSATAIIAGFKGLAAQADEIKNVSERLDITTKSWQELSYVAEQSGVKSEQLQGALTRLRGQVDDLRNGVKDADVPFKALGLNLNAIANAPFEQVLQNIVNGFAQTESSAVRSEAALKLFGEQGLKALQVLQGFQEQAGTINVISDADLNRIDSANDKLLELTRNVKVLASQSLGFLAQQFEKLGAAIYGAKYGVPTDEITNAIAGDNQSKATTTSTNFKIRNQEAEEKAKRDAEQNAREIKRLNEQTAGNREEVRISGLTAEERRNELLKERIKLMEEIQELVYMRGLVPGGDLTKAQKELRLSEVDKELAKKEKPEKFDRVDSDSLSRIGGIVGAGGGFKNPNAKLEQLTQTMLETLRTNGIVVKQRKF